MTKMFTLQRWLMEFMTCLCHREKGTIMIYSAVYHVCHGTGRERLMHWQVIHLDGGVRRLRNMWYSRTPRVAMIQLNTIQWEGWCSSLASARRHKVLRAEPGIEATTRKFMLPCIAKHGFETLSQEDLTSARQTSVVNTCTLKREGFRSSYIQKERPISARLTIEEAIYADCFWYVIIAWKVRWHAYNHMLLAILALSIIVLPSPSKESNT